MAKKQCAICNKGLKFLDVSVNLKDGIVCKKCWNEAGFGDTFNEFMKGSNYTVDDLRNSIKGEVLLGKNVPASVRIQQYEVKNPGIVLHDDEKCYYKGKAEAYHSRKGVVGYEGGHSGVSIRLAKGLSYHTGGSDSKTKRGTIVDKYPATFYMTSDRFVLLSEKYGFELNADEITSIKTYNNGIEFYTKKKTHTVITDDMKRIMELWNLMGEVYKEMGEDNNSIQQKKISNKKNNDPYEEVKKLKELLDLGIISKEEFEKKKKELLNL